MWPNSRICLTLALVGGIFLPNLHAGPFSSIYLFGDSITDVGNVYIATGGAEPAAPYYNGEFSNGPNWAQDFAIGLGFGPLSPSLAPGGTDYAYGGAATSAAFNLPTNPPYPPQGDLLGATGQLAQFQQHVGNVADPNALYVIWIGSNDLIDILTTAPPSSYAGDIAVVAGNIDSAITTLAGIGAKNFLIATVPDLGKAPGLAAESAAASALSAAFNTALTSSLPAPPSGGSILVLNTYALLDQIAANPAFTNSTDPCLPDAVNYAGGTPCANPNQYVFWDNLHPTAAADVFIAGAALSLVTPEPASISLIAVGLLGLAGLRRRCCK